MGTQALSSIDDALQFIETYRDTEQEVPEVEFTGDLAAFSVHIEGKNYAGTIPADLARGLWEFQDELYRAVAFTLYKVDNIRKLTAEQRDNFQLVFKVTEGSTDLFASLKSFMDKLADGFMTMESKHKTITLVAIILILATAWGATKITDSNQDAHKEEVKSNAEVEKQDIKEQAELEKEKQKTEQFKIIAGLANQNQVLSRFSKATEEGAKAIVKGAHDANKIRVGKTVFGRDEIVEVNQREKKGKAVAEILTEKFSIIRIEPREQTSTKIWLAKENAEFSVVVSDEDMDADGQQKLWDAARKREPIMLEINATLIRGQIRSAQLLRVL